MATPARDPACYSAVKRAQAGSPALGQLHHSKGHDPMVLAAGAGGLLPCRPALALPASDEARFIDCEWVDTARDRVVPARLYWPAASTRKSPVPLIVFSHGLGGSRKGYSYLGEGWSARGTASLHIQHVGSDESL